MNLQQPTRLLDFNQSSAEDEKKYGWLQSLKLRLKSLLGNDSEADLKAFAGFKSVLNRSVHAESIRTRDALMKLTLRCGEANTLTLFIQSQTCLKKIFTGFSETALEFLHKSIPQTSHCKQIQSAELTES